ncbi:hypothetical protein [Olivibacter sitiensis]|uniref:hypothetical protein n=1 Tax=Olivibacter sitiensis TaxID=376470 RepID=UPI0003FC77F7|nr:hypothetical protein [Olivibacter sitiensis]
MTPLFKKLNFKQQKEICILNPPAEFETELNAVKDYAAIKTNIDETNELEFVLAFVKTQTDIDTLTPLIDKKLKGDGIVWYAYPKGTSKKYKAAINRDNGWDILGKADFEPVRQVAIDEDWSALRFRKVEFIKVMTRRTDFAMTQQGQLKTKSAKP